MRVLGGRRLRAAIVLMALVAAGCGSTVQNKGRDAAAGSASTGGAAGTGLATTGDTVATDTAITDGASLGATPGGAATTKKSGASSTKTAAKAATASGAGSSSGGSAIAVPTTAQGVTDKEIQIGIPWTDSAGAANAAFGVAGVGQIDQKRAWDALVADMNQHGGIAGRKIAPIFHRIDGTDFTTTTEASEAAICATFTQDNHVFVVLGGGDDSFKQCVESKGVPQIETGNSLADAKTYADFPLLLTVSQPAVDRMARFQVNALAAKSYYSGPVFKLGVVRYDYPTYDRAIVQLRNALSAHNVPITDEIVINHAPSTSGVGDETAAIRAAVLKMKTDGVTHIEFLATPNAFLQFTFMKNAQAQAYNPRYGLDSNDGGQALATLLQNDAGPQLKNALSVGWFPIFDVPASEYPDAAASASWRHCKEVLVAAGQNFGDPTRNIDAQASSMCEQLYFAKAAIEAGGAALSPKSMIAGAEKVEGYDSTMTFGVKMAPSQHDGAAAYRDATWYDDCTCFKYTSGNKPAIS